MNIVLWVLQVLLGVYFIIIGVNHFIVPPGLPAPMSWMYDLSPRPHWLSGIAEILGGLGLILPGLTKRYTWLTPLAAAGLVLVMVGAAVFHITRGEYPNIVQNIILGALAAFVAYGRWKLRPLEDRSPSVAQALETWRRNVTPSHQRPEVVPGTPHRAGRGAPSPPSNQRGSKNRPAFRFHRGTTKAT